MTFVPFEAILRHMERSPRPVDEYLRGNRKFLGEVLRNPGTYFVYDADGILVDSPGDVFQRFSEKTKIVVRPQDIDRWDYLTHTAETFGLEDEVVQEAEKDWYNPQVLEDSGRVLYARPLVYRTVYTHGPKNNFVLTSRLPELDKATHNWFSAQIPVFPEENILIRPRGSQQNESAFKVGEIERLAQKASWVVLIEDSTKYARAVLERGPRNCLVVNVPLGVVKPDFTHERLFVVGRYPVDRQGIYPLMELFKEELAGKTN